MCVGGVSSAKETDTNVFENRGHKLNSRFSRVKLQACSAETMSVCNSKTGQRMRIVYSGSSSSLLASFYLQLSTPDRFSCGHWPGQLAEARHLDRKCPLNIPFVSSFRSSRCLSAPAWLFSSPAILRYALEGFLPFLPLHPCFESGVNGLAGGGRVRDKSRKSIT